MTRIAPMFAPLFLPLLLLALPMVAGAQDHSAGMDHSAHQGYVDQVDREIAALAPEDIEALLAGEGMGYALPAELNRYPGPRHVLDLAGELALEAAQSEAIEAVFERMNERARELGAELVAAERTLNALFAERTADPDRLRDVLAEIGGIEAELRFVHLAAHLETTHLLTQHQIHQYAEARGYGG